MAGTDLKPKKRKRESGRDGAGAPESASANVANGAVSFEKKKKKKRERAETGSHEKLGYSDVAAVTGTAERHTVLAEADKTSSEQLTESVKKVVVPSDMEVAVYLKTHSITVDLGSMVGPSGAIPDSLKPILSLDALLSRIPDALHGAVSSFTKPTPIQACVWSPILEGKDVIGIAETGSGKTLAFGIPAIPAIINLAFAGDAAGALETSNMSKRKVTSRITVLVLAPTRELAIQTHETLEGLAEPFGFGSVAVYGGVDKEPQRKALASMNSAIVVGTPGRVLDLLNEGSCDLSGVKYLVLDEADRMLDKGFENDIRTIIGRTATGSKRQTLMFSATWPDAVRKLASTFLREPVRITVGSEDLTANSRVEQVIEVFDNSREKDQRLTKQLKKVFARRNGKETSMEIRILIFVLYKKEAVRVEETLRRQGYSVAGIHGDLSQGARITALNNFKSGKVQLLVATDVAARGLDIPNVDTVINYSFPLTVEDYIHRIGRTGRGGRSGKSVTFFTGDNHEKALAGELARVLRDSGVDIEPLKKFPMTIKKKEHSAYGAFYRNDIPMPAAPTRLKFD